MEKGINLGGVNDTFSRYIYIHGTSDEKRIGQAVSHGCIRMKNQDVIELFDGVLVNDLVIIK
jgi:lipoprotein-anchoring transpeptidase ErfK/SrfK